MKKYTRRRVLKGMLNGSAVTVALPFLDVFLNSNGTALASNRPMPIRFGTWGYGLGMNPSVFVPKKLGAGYDLPPEIASWKNISQHVNLITNTRAFTDTNSNLCHYTGWVISRTGTSPKDTNDIPGETIDVTVANEIGGTSRFRSLTATAGGDLDSTYSYQNATTPNPPEWSPLAFYTRLFGPTFNDPNAETFTPDPRVMVRKSVLSGVMEDSKKLSQSLGAEDRARVDQYFTGLRQLELQFAQRLVKPEPIAACQPTGEAPVDPPMDKEAASVAIRHKMMTDLMVMAVACDQTRVFNMAYALAASPIIKPGYPKPHHTTTHEEPVDPVLGYQPTHHWFLQRAMESWAEFVEAFASIKEGDGTLLDNVFIYGTTDHGIARTHTLDNMPVFTAGRAGGKMKTGLHIDLNDTAGTRVGLTALHAMGIEKPSWGTLGNEATDVVSEIFV